LTPRRCLMIRAIFPSLVLFAAFGCSSRAMNESSGERVDTHTQAEAAPVSFKKDVLPIFLEHCSDCHVDRAAGNLSLEPDVAYANLVGKASGCATSLVAPGKPEQSELWLSLADDPKACAGVMPRKSAGLKVESPEAFDVIDLWIRQGAKDN